MGKDSKHIGLRLDMPSPTPGVPWLVYPSQGKGEVKDKFYNIVDGRVVELRSKLLRSSHCLATAKGWMFLENFRTQSTFLFNPFSSQQCPLPRLVKEFPQIILIVSDPGKADCFIVGIYRKKHPYLLYTSLRGRIWRKYNLSNIWVDSDSSTLATASDNGKVYLLTSEFLLLVIQFTPRGPISECFNTVRRETYFRPSRCAYLMNLVASFGELFLVETLAYAGKNSRLLKTMTVSKLDFSTKIWHLADTLNERVFVTCRQSSSSFLAANTKLKGNCVYRVSGNVLYCFDIEYQRFSISYPLLDVTYDDCIYFWLVPDDENINYEQPSNHTRKKTLIIGCSYEKFLFDHPKFLSSPTSSPSCIIQRSKTPWLMFTHKDNGTYKFLDPSTKVAYDLLLPDLAGYTILASIKSWLFARRRPFYFIFINPFSKEKIVLPHSNHEPFCMAFSNPPTSPECKIFFISHPYEGKPKVKISIYQVGDDKWTTSEFDDTTTFHLANSNAVYLNGYFYCLGLRGNLGIYDPTNDSWRALGTCINIECEEVCFCTLVESCGRLLSVFLDLFQKPIAMFEFDMNLWRWKRLIDLGDFTFFFGQETSFCVISSHESMKNMIYLPRFQKEYSLDLVAYPLSLSKGRVSDSCTTARTEYVHIWIDPK